MSELKCKICGGSLAITEGSTIATCEYCGTKQLLKRAKLALEDSEFYKADEFCEQVMKMVILLKTNVKNINIWTT